MAVNLILIGPDLAVSGGMGRPLGGAMASV